MSNGRQGEAFDGMASRTTFHRATRMRPASLLGANSTNPSSCVHDAIVRLMACDSHVQEIPR